MWSKPLFTAGIGLLLSLAVNAQPCHFTVQGKVLDEETQEPLSFVNVLIQEIQRGSVTGDDGSYEIKNICEGEYNFIVSHIGCEPKEMHINVYSDTIINVTLGHTAVSLDNVVIQSKVNTTNQPSKSIGKQKIEDNSNKPLSLLLEEETGVYVLKNGGSIGKPVVHGLYGNRLLILNNGVLQSGQQWGNDHSPEIDPLMAQSITVVKGTNALEYGGGNLGSIILVEPKKIGRDPHIHGRINYAYETNGRGNYLNGQLQKYSPWLAWKINGSVKRVGDRNAPSYYLNNTGAREANLSIQLEKSWNDKFFMDLYGSTFNTTLGILRGSHIGNVSDLELALLKDEPFFTEENFSDSINAPKQSVQHHLIKLNTKYYFNSQTHLQIVGAAQINNRKEFDVRRSGRSEIPALSLLQHTYSFDVKFHKETDSEWKWTIGSQQIFTDNTNNPETGILPLIPDYLSIKSGMFGTIEKQYKKYDFNMGLRYDFEYQNVATISNTAPREIIRYENNFNNINATVGLGYTLSKEHTIKINTGYASRNPAVNELYSNGLHQGVSGIEEGNISLSSESAWKSTFEYELKKGPSISFSTLLYYQRFNNYIFLRPEDEFRLTIRGAFPVFTYDQTDAEILGSDVSLQFTPDESFYGQLKYSYIRGNDLANGIPLVNIPPANFLSSLTYRLRSLEKLRKINIEDVEFMLDYRYVFRQNHLLPEQDFVLPPDAYGLFGVKASFNWIKASYKARVFMRIENLLNTTYRDYLNRQRYFADDVGRNMTIGLTVNF